MESGDVYEGEFKYDKMDGQGVYKFKDGVIFTGEFKNDLMSGAGKFELPKSDPKDKPELIEVIGQTQVKLGSTLCEGELKYEDGSILKGKFDKGLATGKGKRIKEKEYTYDGDFIDGKFHGQGTMVY